jgi:hypothetical protein
MTWEWYQGSKNITNGRLYLEKSLKNYILHFHWSCQAVTFEVHGN